MNINLIEEGTIVQVYAPTQDYSEEDIEAFYEDISKVIQDNRQSKYNIIMGDFNAKIGTKKPDEMFPCMGQFGICSKNERGNRLIEFALYIYKKISLLRTLY